MLAVLIPTYQPKEYYLRWCLESLSKQTIDKNIFKLYICLNGSDSLYKKLVLEILEGFEFNYELLEIEEAGVSNCRNFLISHTSEEYVTFIDDDDKVSPDYLQELLSVTSPESMGISKLVNFDKSELMLHPVNAVYDNLKDVEVNKVKCRTFFNTMTGKMFHRSMFEGWKLDPHLKNGEDSLFLAQISCNVKFIHKTKSDVFYHIYLREDSASRKVTSFSYIKNNTMYLIQEYSKLLTSSSHSKLFILTRILAAFKVFLNRSVSKFQCFNFD